MALFGFLRKRSGAEHGTEGKKSTYITSINIRLGGDVHSLGGREVGETFDIDIPFKNKMGSGLLPENLKGPDVTISSITVDKPFELIAINPGLPAEVPYMSESRFALRIKSPGGSYNGPLMVRFETGSTDNIDVSIARIMLSKGAKRVELESSASSMNIKKGQVFRRDIQLYKVLSLGDRINNIEVSRPFALVSTDPALPLSIDVKDSYILKMFIKCPDFSYAGELEIAFR